ncbi:metallophosphoesterase [Paenibacillus sp. JCM 10914]|uniref:metallophosphoesterase n=1 Tax=Paenibacillus sp. JCM 10914 TaxID=1236974 RepID=UPI0003CCB57C|nr:metallophosphoesterase [Paenibacillus sp. JCM 10914]GAE08189.1 predicted phosphohydrolases [Paenibacillus sp. JCM 10914]
MKNAASDVENTSPTGASGKGKAMSRRQFLKLGASAIAGTGLIGATYASLWEPKQLDITRLTLAYSSLPRPFHGLKIAHFSDLHLGFQTSVKDVTRLVEAIHDEQVDIVCFTGDMVDGEAEEMLAAVQPLSMLRAQLGVFSILGNHDYGHVNRLISLEEEAGFQVLRNTHVKLKREGAVIAIAGLDDGIWGQPDLEAALQGVSSETFKLLLMHEPDFADTAAVYSVQLQLSGHSHGGQIRLPWIGEVITPPGAKRYVQGLYTLSEGTQVYVNRGIGTTQLPMRFLCQPELTIITLHSSIH